MKTIALLSLFALVGACSNYTMADGQKECCAEAQAQGKSCCEEMKDCEAMQECSGAKCDEKAMAACCAEAKAAGKDCAKCAK